MVQNYVVLEHKVSFTSIKIDPAKVEVIEKLTLPMNDLLTKEAIFYFYVECLSAFNLLKECLISAIVVVAPIGHCCLSLCMMLMAWL